MATDLKKMVEEWRSIHYGLAFPLKELLTAMAAEIEANREEVQQLKTQVLSHFAAHQAEDCKD